MLLRASRASLGVGAGSFLQSARLEIGFLRWKSSCHRRRLSRRAPPPVTTKEVTQMCRSAAHQGEACVPGWVEVEGPAGHPPPARRCPKKNTSAPRHGWPFADGPPPVLTVELAFPID